MQKSTRSSLLAMTVLVASAGMGAMTQANPDPARTTAREDSRQADRGDKSSPSRLGMSNSIEKALLGGFGHRGRKSRYPNGPGWTQAHVQRMARKRRNQQRNKRAHRG